jgi:methylthioribose-1-phosphate isomerase
MPHSRSDSRGPCESRLGRSLEVVEEEAVNCRKDRSARSSHHRGNQPKKGGQPVNILTHCNAGWLACVEYGTATAPIYTAFDHHIPVHVWVDETRPLNQGSRLTAWELGKHGIPHTVITDNAGGHLMQHGMVDLVIVGTDRTTRAGRCGQQDRHLFESPCGPGQQHSFLCGPALIHLRLDTSPTA